MDLKPTGVGVVSNRIATATPPSALSNVETTDSKVQDDSYAKEIKRELNSPYIDSSEVTIVPQDRKSLYRVQNYMVLDQPKFIIGGSCDSARILVSNAGEVEKYFPKIVGCMPNHPDFLDKVKTWLDNITIVVPSDGYTLDTSFRYNKKSDYMTIADQVAAINKAYDAADKTTAKGLMQALKVKQEAINSVESTKWMYGEPVNANHYIVYRHCLLYNDIAKDMRLFQFKPNVRFYFKDEKQEEEIAAKRQQVAHKAMANYLNICGNADLFEAVYTIYCHNSGFDLAVYLNKKQIDKEILLRSYSETSPYKFNKLVEDRNVSVKAMIEQLISLGDLIRDENNNRIGTRDAKIIGNNMEGAVLYFTDPANKAIREMYEAKLKSAK